MAHVTLVAAAIAMAIAVHMTASTHASALPLDLVIHNNFETYNLTVQCDSDLQAHPDKHLVPPKGMYKFSFDPHVEHQWSCALSATSTTATMEPCRGQASYRGRFMMWQNHMPIPPMREPMCEDHGECPWLVDAGGLALIRHPGDEPMHIYDWPAQVGATQSQGPGCTFGSIVRLS